jgi:hypothetical protein
MLTRGKIDISQAEIRLRIRKNGKMSIIPTAPPLLDVLKAQAKLGDPEAPIHPNAYQTLSRSGIVCPLSP